MARPRKTLGSPDSPPAQALLGLVQAREKQVVAAWAISFAKQRLLPVFEHACPGDTRVQEALDAGEAWLKGALGFPVVKGIILNRAHAVARELEDRPAAQAAARACAQAASAIHVKEHALGLLYYGAAALAYAQLGTDGDKEAYQRVYEGFARELMNSVQQISSVEENSR